MTDTYRNWSIDFDPKPIPSRAFDWTATHPDYDGPEDERIVSAATFEALTVEIDCAIMDLEDANVPV